MHVVMDYGNRSHFSEVFVTASVVEVKVKEGIVSMLGTSRATAFICAKISSLMTANLSLIKEVLQLPMNRPILLLYFK